MSRENNGKNIINKLVKVVQKEVLERPEKRFSEFSMFNHLNRHNSL